MGHEEFDRAVAAYKAGPTPDGLQVLLRLALDLKVEGAWRHVRGKDAFAGGFRQIRAVCDRALDNEEVRRLAGCIGYALKATLAGEELGEPVVRYALTDGAVAFTTLVFAYDSQMSARTSPDFAQAFVLARQYAFEGTPVRTTDREGRGTKDTRLVEGIAACSLGLYVR